MKGPTVAYPIQHSSVSAEIDGEIARFIDEAHQRVKKILSERRKVLDQLAHLLSEKESVQGDELRRMLVESKHEMVNGSRGGKWKKQCFEKTTRR
jgi:cell division protease FtsH